MLLTALLAIALVVVLGLLLRMKVKVTAVMKSERMKLTFLKNINHEIRSPLKMFHQLAETVGKPDLYLSKNEKRNISDQMIYNANLIATLLDEVMVLTDTEPVGHRLLIESFSPNALCRRCLEANMHSIFHRQAVRLTFKRDLSDEFFVKSDRHLVELIVNKLVINACKFTEEGEITLGCNTSERPDRLVIYVSDTGKGIPEGRLGSIFSYFEKPDDLQDEAELDLSLCGRIAKTLGGELVHDNRYATGTRMVLILPLR